MCYMYNIINENKTLEEMITENILLEKEECTLSFEEFEIEEIEVIEALSTASKCK